MNCRFGENLTLKNVKLKKKRSDGLGKNPSETEVLQIVKI